MNNDDLDAALERVKKKHGERNAKDAARTEELDAALREGASSAGRIIREALADQKTFHNPEYIANTPPATDLDRRTYIFEVRALGQEYSLKVKGRLLASPASQNPIRLELDTLDVSVTRGKKLTLNRWAASLLPIINSN